MFTNALTLTDTGKALQLRALDGEAFTFTKFQVGKGVLGSGDDPEKMEALKSLVIDDISITRSVPVNNNDTDVHYLRLDGVFYSTGVLTAFTWTEIGLIAEDDGGTEYLYAYGYETTEGELIRDGSSIVSTEQSFSCTISVGTTQNITANVIPNVSYAAKALLDSHVDDENNPHQVTAEKIGAAPATHTHAATDINSGVLPESNGGTGMSSLQTLAAAISELIIVQQDFVMGTYTGNGSSRKNISLGFKPSKVFILPSLSGMIKSRIEGLMPKATDYVFFYPSVIFPGKNSILSGGNYPASLVTASVTTLVSSARHGWAAVTNTGFSVGDVQENDLYVMTPNSNGFDYFYIAFK